MFGLSEISGMHYSTGIIWTRQNLPLRVSNYACWLSVAKVASYNRLDDDLPAPFNQVKNHFYQKRVNSVTVCVGKDV